MFFKWFMNMLMDLYGTHVDSILQAGEKSKNKEKNYGIKTRFYSMGYDASEAMHNWILCDVGNFSDRKFSQAHYVKRLSFLKGSTFHEFRSLMALLSWLVHTMPYISSGVSFASQVREFTHGSKHVQLSSHIVKRLQNSPEVLLLYKK